MNLTAITSEAVLSAIGMSLLHSLWQVALVALIIFALLRVLRQATANSRYLVASAGLLTAMILPVFTFFKLYEPQQALTALPDTQASLLEIAYTLADSQLKIESRLDQLIAFVERLAPSVFWFWLTGMVVMALRLSGGYYLAFRYRSKGVVRAENHWQQRLHQLALKMQIRSKVVLLESYKTTVPMVVGLLKPCIIVPVGTLSRLPFDQVEMILAHELAHIRRADFFVNFLQSLIETILFFNPFVWWISSVIRLERENICDDMALRTTGGYLSLAKALANLSVALEPVPLSDSLITFNKLNTMKRIERLISKPKLKPTVTERISVVVFSFLFVLFITASGMLTGSNSDAVSSIDNVQSVEEVPAAKQDTVVTKSKTIEVEKKDGKVVKMIIDGKEVPKEELDKAGFEWKSEDGKTSKVIVKSVGNATTDDMDTEVTVWTDENGKTVAKKTIRAGGSDGGMKNKTIMVIADSIDINDGEAKVIVRRMPEGKAVFKSGEESYTFDFEVDEDEMGDLEGENLKHFVIRKKNFQDEENNLRRQADELVLQADKLRAEAEKLQNTDADAAAKMQEEAVRLSDQAAAIHQSADAIQHIAFPEMPEMPAPPPAWKEQRFAVFDTDEPNERQYHVLLRKELVYEGIINPKSNVLLSKKQLIIDNQVADRKTHKMVLKRFEDITGRKVEANEAVSLKK